ncbi:hypothetical protein BVRB_6g147960 isoform A [Beta vulgaris subsp. vulgaris]|nr:hypothetical protein BVRB_6g147960 isoform A [Beta vulgaris subsp. vulgaris]
MAPEMAKAPRAAEDKRKVKKSSPAPKKAEDKRKVDKLSVIPEFSVMLRTQCTGRGLMWVRVDDVCKSMNKMVNRHKQREEAAATHNHDIGTCDRNLFPTKKYLLKVMKPMYPSSCTAPPNSLCVCINNTLYCVGGDEDIWAFHNVASEMYTGSWKLEPKPLSYFLDQNKEKFDLLQRPRLNLSHWMIQAQFPPPPKLYHDHDHDHAKEAKARGDRGKGKAKSKSIDDDDTNACIWSWVESPLTSPRFFPQVVTVGDKLYFFGGNRPPFPEVEKPTDMPFGEVYGPGGQFRALPEPPFPRIPSKTMVLLPCLGDKGEEKILVASTAYYPAPSATVMYWYDTHDQSWTEFKDDDQDHNLYYTLFEKYGDSAVPVAEHNATYWLNGAHTPLSLCCYDWKSCKLYEGEFLQHFGGPCRPRFLFHLQGDLFCLIDEEVEDEKPVTQFHFILLLVSKNDSNATLDTKLFGCYCCKLSGVQCIRYAHLLKL